MPRRSFALSFALTAVLTAMSASAAPVEQRCITVDLYAAAADEAAGRLAAGLEAFATDRGGLTVVRRFIDTVPEDREALVAAAKREGFAADALPAAWITRRAKSTPAVAPSKPPGASRRDPRRQRINSRPRRGSRPGSTAGSPA